MRQMNSTALNINPDFEQWHVPVVTNPRDDFEFCHGWKVSSVAGDEPFSFSLRPLDAVSERGVRLSVLGEPRSIGLYNVVPDGAVLSKRHCRLIVRIRGSGPGTSPPRLIGAHLLRAASPAQWIFDQKLLPSAELGEMWTYFEVSFGLHHSRRPATRAGRLWDLLRRAIFRRGSAQSTEERLALQFSGQGFIEIESCSASDIQEHAAPVSGFAELDEMENPWMTRKVEPISVEVETPSGRPTGKDHKVLEGRIIAIINRRVLGWVKPGPSEVRASLCVDGDRVGTLGPSDFSGAEKALLGEHCPIGFGVTLALADPPTDNDSLVSIRDDTTGTTVKDSIVRLRLNDGLHIPQ